MGPNQVSENNATAVAPDDAIPLDDIPAATDESIEAPTEVRQAVASMPATGVHFNFAPFEQIAALAQAGRMDDARAVYDQLDDQQRYVYNNIRNMERVPASEAARLADEFRKMQDAQAKAANSSQAVALQKQSEQRRAASLDTISSMRSTINDVLEHPGFSGSVGAKNASYLFGLKSEPIAGTKEADFKALLDQVQGGAFLQAFESLKGGGQITQIEGEKATQAIVRAQQSQSEEGFKKSMNDFLSVLDKAEKRTLGGQSSADSPAPAATATRAAATAMPRATKTIGGATWEKGDDGKWYKKR